jgi:hypothetical protein
MLSEKFSISRMPFAIETSSNGRSYKGKGIVVNTLTGKHYSTSPIPIQNAKAQMRALYAAIQKKDDK